jgi:hypothetical protein
MVSKEKVWCMCTKPYQTDLWSFGFRVIIYMIDYKVKSRKTPRGPESVEAL